MQQRTKEDILTAVYIASLVTVNLIGSKITYIFGQRVTVGIFFVPILFLVTDIIGEVRGKKVATRLLLIAMGILVALIGALLLAIHAKPHPTWGNQEAYATIFKSSLRMTIASVIAFGISQFFDVFAFDFWKRRTKGKFLWLRNNLSTMMSQFIDSTIFMFLAFYMITPKYTASFLFGLILVNWSFKVVLALLDTPICYLGVRWMYGKEGKPEGSLNTE